MSDPVPADFEGAILRLTAEISALTSVNTQLSMLTIGMCLLMAKAMGRTNIPEQALGADATRLARMIIEQFISEPSAQWPGLHVWQQMRDVLEHWCAPDHGGRPILRLLREDTDE